MPDLSDIANDFFPLANAIMILGNKF